MFDRLFNKLWRTIVIPNAIIRIGNSVFKVPRLHKVDFYKSRFYKEQWLITLLTKIDKVKKIDVFIDVGVNIGQTLLKIKFINKDVQYFGFEPNPFCCTVTQRIIEINKFSECSLIPCGLGDSNDLFKLIMSDENNILDSSASMIEGFRDSKNHNYQIISSFKLDDVYKQLSLKKIDVIKIDIEGAELEAIRGMKKILMNFKPLILMEVLPAYDDKNVFRISRQNELAQLLKEANYSILQIKRKEKDIYFEEVDEFPVHKNLNESDYLLLPKNININDFEFNLS